MEAVWRRLVFHFLWALAILLTGILSGLRVNAVSFAFFASRSLTSLEIFADPPQTPPASLLCPLHGHFAAFSFFLTARTLFALPIQNSVVSRIRLQHFRCVESQVNAAKQVANDIMLDLRL